MRAVVAGNTAERGLKSSQLTFSVGAVPSPLPMIGGEEVGGELQWPVVLLGPPRSTARLLTTSPLSWTRFLPTGPWDSRR